MWLKADSVRKRRKRRSAGLAAATVAVVLASSFALSAPTAAEPAPAGIDVASYQHPSGQEINWPAVASSGIRFVFTKATESTTYTNPYFATDRAAALAAGLGVGAYHFANPANSPIADAQYFLSVVGTASPVGTLPPVLDLEQTGGLAPAALSNWAVTWLQYVANAVGRAPLFYASPNFITGAMTPDSRLGQFPLWLASYTSVTPAAPAPWATWLFWQYSSDGIVPGINGRVDQNRYAGDLLSLQRLALIAPVIATGDMYYTVATDTASGSVELHTLSRGSGYQGYNSHIATALPVIPDPEAWQFVFAPLSGLGGHDLFAIHLANTGSGRVEVHVLSEISGYRTWVAHIATPLGVIDPANWQVRLASFNGDNAANLYLIKTQGSDTGRVEVHVLSAASRYQTWALHAATLYSSTPNDQFTYLIGDPGGLGDLVAIARYGTSSGRSELHVLSRASNYTDFTAHVVLPMGPTPDPAARFSLVQWDGDGRPDLLLAQFAGGSGRTELHVMGSAYRYGEWIAHIATGAGALDWRNSTIGLLT
ncbi:MAG: Integrin-like repeat domain fused to lysozyme, glycosyl hydrolase [Pseudonocardiales bacterium]|nr:Integrin-like repeat domain fused to lysozyme, glycosyl hydrolase [Pseudonocardiales bacterium]